jgi:hypothetical protein
MIYRIKISPESISSMVKVFNYDGNSVGVYTGMTSVLTGGTNGASTLTGLTIPILLTQDNIDMGYYSEFDADAETSISRYWDGTEFVGGEELC